MIDPPIATPEATVAEPEIVVPTVAEPEIPVPTDPLPLKLKPERLADPLIVGATALEKPPVPVPIEIYPLCETEFIKVLLPRVPSCFKKLTVEPSAACQPTEGIFDDESLKT